MVKFFKYIILLLSMILIALVGIFAVSIETQPLVVSKSGEQVSQAESVKKLMRQLSASVKNRTQKQEIVVSEDQLNSLVGFAQRANNNISGNTKIKATSTRISTSYTLPKNPIGRYINVEIALLPGQGVTLDFVKVGPFTIPGHLALGTLITLANWYTDSDIASQFVKQIESISMSEQTVRLSVLPLAQFLVALNEVRQGVGGVKDEGMRLRTAYYLKHLSTLAVSEKPTPQSLGKYMGPLFKWAQRRSTYETAAQENEAAIMALAIYAGHHRFANLVGDVQPVLGKVALPKAKPMLRYRADLNQHFIFSAAIKILSEQGLSIAIGEFKELMDRSKDGSGYSFVDLAADFAGVEFAVAATSTATASKLQNILADQISERNFFPDITDLPEGLRKAEFEQTFGQVDSPAYLAMVDTINQRIARLPIHQAD